MPADAERAKPLPGLQLKARDGQRSRRELAVRTPELNDLGAVVLNRVVVHPPEGRQGLAGAQAPGIADRQRPHLPIPVPVDVEIILAIVEEDGDGGGRCIKRDQPCQQLDSEGPHEPLLGTFQPRPRTLRITSAPKRRRSPWMITSTALLETASPQP